jgi:hypothetical protein
MQLSEMDGCDKTGTSITMRYCFSGMENACDPTGDRKLPVPRLPRTPRAPWRGRAGSRIRVGPMNRATILSSSTLLRRSFPSLDGMRQPRPRLPNLHTTGASLEHRRRVPQPPPLSCCALICPATPSSADASSSVSLRAALSRPPPSAASTPSSASALTPSSIAASSSASPDHLLRRLGLRVEEPPAVWRWRPSNRGRRHKDRGTAG